MTSFADIITTYSDIKDRNIEYLSRLYQDKEYLFDIIKSLIERNIPDDKIYNKKVLLKPNWVKHNFKETDYLCLRTDDNFTLAALAVILEKKPKQIIIGDAPIQGCDWGKMLSKSFYDAVKKLSLTYDIPIIIKDFRRVVLDAKYNILSRERISLDNYVIFDVGQKSYLEPITSDENLFRVTNYDAERFKETHVKGMHKYCIIKDVFESDIVITLPKVKTHQKTGITNAMKILVGVNGDKDYLPHHRKGSPAQGGDCYPYKNVLRTLSEHILDKANKFIGKKSYKPLSILSGVLFKLSKPNKETYL
jgi:hypothetical protein